MNRLIIVGNGYDLSLGLESSYKSFLMWYFQSKIIPQIRSIGFSYDDGLIKLNNNDGKLPSDDFDKKDLRKCMEQIRLVDKLHSGSTVSPLLEKCIIYGRENWVDIEQTYYDLLCLYSVKKIKSDQDVDMGNVKRLNQDLETITNYLVEYLNEIEAKIDTSKFPINWHELKTPFAINESGRNQRTEKIPKTNLEKVLILNFNYTSTLSTLKRKLEDQHVDVDIINIHGNIKKPHGPIIFGYGDETIQSYMELENANINECLKNIKSFKYLESRNYQKLLNFVDFNHFDVLIAGHSCGISDRVLLKAIFEHPNCVFIKPFIYKIDEKSDNFFDIAAAISRHFSSNQEMREKVSQKEFCPYFN